MGRKLDEDDVIRVMHQRIVGVSESRARIVASYVPTAEPSAADCWKCNDNKTTDDPIDTKSSRYGTDRTTDELISKLSDLRSQYNCFDESERDAYGVLSEAIKALSAQPETHEKRTETHGVCLDTISRQDAIDALFDWEMTYNWDDHCREEDPKPAYIVSPSDVIEQLPSAQPEIIRCKDCKHWDGVDTCDVIDAPVWDNDFCSMAERRNDEA